MKKLVFDIKRDYFEASKVDMNFWEMTAFLCAEDTEVPFCFLLVDPLFVFTICQGRHIYHLYSVSLVTDLEIHLIIFTIFSSGICIRKLRNLGIDLFLFYFLITIFLWFIKNELINNICTRLIIH